MTKPIYTPNLNEQLHIVYMALDLTNDKPYIGKAGKFKRRQHDHIRNALSGSKLCPVFYPALKDHKPENFKWYKLYETHDEDLAYDMEHFFIGLFNTNVLREDSWGYNCSDGGKGGMRHITTQETRDKRSIAMTKNWSDEEFHNTQQQSIKDACNRDDVRKIKSDAMINVWEDDDKRQKLIDGLNRPNVLEENTQTSKALWEDEEYRNKQLKTRGTKEHKEKESQGAKDMWSRSTQKRHDDLVDRNRKQYEAIFPDGHKENVYGLKVFCIEHGINYNYVFRYIKLQKPLNGFLFKQLHTEKKKFKVTFPDGHSIEVDNLSEFCREHGLVISTVCCAKSKGRSHKDFFFEDI